VLTAMDGAAAVRMYGERHDAIQLVMTDMMMRSWMGLRPFANYRRSIPP